MFTKHLSDEHQAPTTPLATRSSRGTPSSSDQRGKRPAAALLGSSSKKSRPSSFDPGVSQAAALRGGDLITPSGRISPGAGRCS
ncbi:UNVERIFIED_CONTAM: hypothetical protein Sangu_2461800 [Sesamum angustifolium]|uniref:Uncharacterized protein n=1 Tax=Sesamum angustifolium TaxID=2727405 RepID=A0AAW2JWP9_9LAMI